MICRLALCDDHEGERAQVQAAAASALADVGFLCEFSLFSSGEELLRVLEKEAFDLVLMNIHMPGIDGIETGRQIRNRGMQTHLAYVSGQEHRVFEVFPIQPLGFVRKGRLHRDMIQLARQYRYAALKLSDHEAVLETRTGTVRLDTGKIRYIEGLGNYQMVYLADEAAPLEIKMTMDRLEAVLESCGFLRIHRGYLVNYGYIARVTYDYVFLSDGGQLPVGQSRARTVRREYLRMQENRA